MLRRIALAAALIAIGVAIAVGGRAWHQFSSSDVGSPSSPPGTPQPALRQRAHDFWRVAIDAFDEEPLLGHGAGTYHFSWDQLRHDSMANLDAHSLYLQAFAELGLVGGLLVLAMVGRCCGPASRPGARRAGRGATSTRPCSRASLAFAICSAIDWFWQIAAIGAIFFLATGVLVAARCAQLAQERASGDGHRGRAASGSRSAGSRSPGSRRWH